jgi:hypothetical protein
VSVATAVTTNMRLKLIMNSNAKAWPYGAPEGTVTLPPIMGWKIHFSAKAAHNDAVTWAPIYIGTCQNNKKILVYNFVQQFYYAHNLF